MKKKYLPKPNVKSFSGDHVVVPIGNTGTDMIVNIEFAEWSKQWKWQLSPQGYAWRYDRPNKKVIWFHKEVLPTPKGLVTDHINGNAQDNRKSNLRIVSHAINAWNTIQNKKRKYDKDLPTGIAWDNTRGKYIATRILRKRFETLDEAINFQKESELYDHEHRRLKPNFPTGIFQNKSTKGYQAKIQINGERIYLGTFATIEEAEQAYLDRKRG